MSPENGTLSLMEVHHGDSLKVITIYICYVKQTTHKINCISGYFIFQIEGKKALRKHHADAILSLDCSSSKLWIVIVAGVLLVKWIHIYILNQISGETLELAKSYHSTVDK
jgi:hypothetical protein